MSAPWEYAHSLHPTSPKEKPRTRPSNPGQGRRTAGRERMPRNKSTRKSRTRATRPPARSSKRQAQQRAPSKPHVPKAIRIPARLESYLKAEALQKAGLYTPKKKLDVRTFTFSQARHVNQVYSRTQAHGAFIRGKAERPFIRTLHGYKMNPSFKTVQGKRAQAIPGAIVTNRGVIVPREMMQEHPRVLKDGTLVYRSKRLGKTREIFSGTLTPAQTLRLIQQLENGTFKLPRDKRGKKMQGAAMIFNAFTLRGIKYFATENGLRKYLAEYNQKFLDTIERYPTFAPRSEERRVGKEC